MSRSRRAVNVSSPPEQKIGEHSILAARGGERKGRVWPVGNIRSAFEAAVVTARIDKEFTFHGCRHHFASWFVMQGGSLAALQQLLGHATLAMTMKYAQVGDGHLRDEVARTERRPAAVFSDSKEKASSATISSLLSRKSA